MRLRGGSWYIVYDAMRVAGSGRAKAVCGGRRETGDGVNARTDKMAAALLSWRRVPACPPANSTQTSSHCLRFAYRSLATAPHYANGRAWAGGKTVPTTPK